MDVRFLAIVVRWREEKSGLGSWRHKRTRWRGQGSVGSRAGCLQLSRTLIESRSAVTVYEIAAGCIWLRSMKLSYSHLNHRVSDLA